MARQAVFVTGDKKLDRAMARLEKKLIKKLLPKAAKEAAKISMGDYKKRVPVDWGSMRDAVATRVTRKKHKAATGKTVIAKGGFLKGKRVAVKRVVAEDIGATVIIDHKKLARLYSRNTGDDLTFFYPAMQELGGSRGLGERPLTKSLYNNSGQIKSEFMSAMRRLVMGARK